MMMSGVLTALEAVWLNSSTLIGSDELPRMLICGRAFGLLPAMLFTAKLMDASMFFSVCSRFCPLNTSSSSEEMVDTAPV